MFQSRRNWTNIAAANLGRRRRAERPGGSEGSSASACKGRELAPDIEPSDDADHAPPSPYGRRSEVQPHQRLDCLAAARPALSAVPNVAYDERPCQTARANRRGRSGSKFFFQRPIAPLTPARTALATRDTASPHISIAMGSPIKRRPIFSVTWRSPCGLLAKCICA
jgi:hypothetical protein